MKNRRPVFALEYIEETVSAFDICLGLEIDAMPSEEVSWAEDVLCTYFDKVTLEGNSILESCYCRFLDARKYSRSNQFKSDEKRKIPYRRDLNAEPSVTPQELRALCVRRRSVRWFLDKKVPRHLVDDSLETGILAPSACNRQPYRFEIFDNPADVSMVASIPKGTAGFHQNFPMIVVVVGDLSAYPEERDRHCIYIDGSLAVMGVTLALETHGLSSCVINWPDIEVRERLMDQRLSLSVCERVICLIAVGWPDPNEKVPYSQKKELDSIRRYG